MADEYLGNWAALVKAVKSKIPSVLEHVAPTAEKALNKRMEKDIYKAYKPKVNGWISEDGKTRATYQRRYSLKGTAYSLLPKGSNTLTVTAFAWPRDPIVKGWVFVDKQEGAFLEMLEKGARRGRLGIWVGGFNRPAVGNLQKEINDGTGNGLLINRAIRDGITKEIGKGYIEK